MLRRHQKVIVATAAILGALSGAGFLTTPAMASTSSVNDARPVRITSTNIDGWHVGIVGNCAGVNQFWIYCLYYSPGGDGGVWGSINQNTGTITGRFQAGAGNAGVGQAVRNNAASMGNATGGCNVTTWVSPNFTGAFNWLHAGWDGNLNSALRNNEASISANNCS